MVHRWLAAVFNLPTARWRLHVWRQAVGLLYHFEECVDRYVVHVRTFTKERVPARLDRFFFSRTQRTRKQGVWRCCSSVAGGWRHGVRHRSRCLACCNWPASCLHGDVEAVMHSLHPCLLLCRVHGPIDQPSAIPNTIQLLLVLGLFRVEKLGVASRTVILFISVPIEPYACMGWARWKHAGAISRSVSQYVRGMCSSREHALLLSSHAPPQRFLLDPLRWLDGKIYSGSCDLACL